MKNLKKKTDKPTFVQFQFYIFYNLACLQINFHGRLLSIRVFSADGHYLTVRPAARKGYGSIAHEAKPNGLLTRGP